MNIREELSHGATIYELPLRVAFYARVSTDHELQSTSIVNQVEYFSQYIKNNKSWTYVRGYVDEGISGKSVDKRGNFLKMINDAKANQFDLLLTKSVSRFARNTIDSIYYTDVLLGYGVGVFFLNDNINTFYSDSEFRLTLMASIAQDELRKLSESVRFGLRQSIQRGVVLGNSNILGYRKDRGKLVIVDEEAKIVRDIFEMYSIGEYSYLDLARKINFKYHFNYDSTRIKRILTNYKYKGYYCGRKSMVMDYKHNKRKYIEEGDWIVYRDYEAVPPIVEEELWDMVHEMILQRKSGRCHTFDRYKGIVFCGMHNKAFLLKYKKYKNKYYGYLVCPNCSRLSVSLLDRIWNVKTFQRMIVYKK